MSALETSVSIHWLHISPALYYSLTVYGRTTVQAFNIPISSVADLYNDNNETGLDTIWYIMEKSIVAYLFCQPIVDDAKPSSSPSSGLQLTHQLLSCQS
jgi:hypothetical protein